MLPSRYMEYSYRERRNRRINLSRSGAQALTFLECRGAAEGRSPAVVALQRCFVATYYLRT